LLIQRLGRAHRPCPYGVAQSTSKISGLMLADVGATLRGRPFSMMKKMMVRRASLGTPYG